MKQKVNYQRILDQTLNQLTKTDKVPSLLLHSCCAPCSSYVLEYLAEYFSITVFFYNPNIYPQAEYCMRVEEVKRLVQELPTKHPIRVIEGTYDPESFFKMAKGMEHEPEGQKRCYACYKMRLEEAAKEANVQNADYFTTTLSISPLKNAEWLNEIGAALEKQYGVSYLYSDFKKKGGYQRSIVLSKEYELYRQNFCGCVYSAAEAKKREESKKGI